MWTALPSAQAQALPTHQMWQRYHAATQEAQWHRVVRASCDALHLYQGGHGPINACNAGTTRRCSASATCSRPCCCHLMTTPFFCWMSNSWSWSTIRNISAGDNAKLLLTMPPPPLNVVLFVFSQGGLAGFLWEGFLLGSNAHPHIVDRDWHPDNWHFLVELPKTLWWQKPLGWIIFLIKLQVTI